ncbi:MAG: sulfurtransferase [Alicyclobacillus sp.]|nr:sulfurtransferase [Alicyclobacillus sp.]
MLIRAHELQTHLQDPRWVVFDCRFTLANPAAGRQKYLEGHIPGAYYLDMEHDLSSPKQEHGGRHPLPDPQELAAKLSAAGVTAASELVVYDDGGGMALRAWWLLRYLGAKRVYVLDGGWSAWLAADGPVSQEVPGPRAGLFPLQVHHDWLVPVAEVERIARGEQPGMLVDARAQVRFRGEQETSDPVAGHIPGAYNAPWEEGLTADGRWRDAAEQRQRFAFVQDPKEVVMYCGSGVTACANLFAMELAGLHGARLYAGSWSDWISYPHHPVEVGPGRS